MHIDRIELTNFGSFMHAVLDFPTRVTLVYGENGSGKSTIEDAITWGFKGACRGTDARGVGVEHLFHTGADTMSVGLQLHHHEGQGELERKAKGRSTTLQVGNNSGPAATQQAVLFKALGINEDVLSALLDSRAFLDLSHADAKAVLLKALGAKVIIDGKSLTLEQLDAKYAEAFEQRKTAKAAQLAIRVPDAPKEQAPDVAALEQALADLREQEQGMVATAAQGDGRRGALEQELTTAENDLRRVDTAINQTTDVTADLDALVLKLSESDPVTEDDETLQDARTGLVDAEGRLKLAEQTANTLVNHDPKRGCVLDGTIPCKTPAKEFSGQIVALEKRVTDLQSIAAKLETRIATHRKAVSDRRDMEGRIRTLREKHAGRVDLLLRQEELKAVVFRLHDQISALPAAAAKNQALDDLKARIVRGDGTIREARSLVDAWARHKDAKAQAAAQSRKVQELEARVELLGPKGERARALQAAMAAFESLINNALTRFGYSMTFCVDPWIVTVNGRSIVRLSESERLRVGLSLQFALAEATQIGFVLIDGADMLTTRNRVILAELLELHTGQVVITASRDEDLAVQPIDGVTIYRLSLKDGVTQVERVGEAVAA